MQWYNSCSRSVDIRFEIDRNVFDAILPSRQACLIDSEQSRRRLLSGKRRWGVAIAQLNGSIVQFSRRTVFERDESIVTAFGASKHRGGQIRGNRIDEQTQTHKTNGSVQFSAQIQRDTRECKRAQQSESAWFDLNDPDFADSCLSFVARERREENNLCQNVGTRLRSEGPIVTAESGTALSRGETRLEIWSQRQD